MLHTMIWIDSLTLITTFNLSALTYLTIETVKLRKLERNRDPSK